MAPAVWAALIQGFLTLGAALIAVGGVSSQIGNWRHEVPGRRKIKVAEECMVAALAQQRLVARYSSAVRRAMELELEPQLIAERRSEHVNEEAFWREQENKMDQLSRLVGDGVANLEHASDVAEVYFQGSVRAALGKMRSAGSLVTERRMAFFKPSSPEDRQQAHDLLNLPFTNGAMVSPQETVAIRMYRIALDYETARPDPDDVTP